MKRKWFMAAGIVLAATLLVSCAEDTAPAAAESQGSLAAPETLVEKVSYALGYMMSDSYKSQGVELDHRYFGAAMQDVMEGSEALFTPEEMNGFLMEYQDQLIAEQQAEMAASAEVNLAAAESFLAENSGREGIFTTESGLQYEVLSEGPADGQKPTAEDTVTVHYSGTLLDGSVFDSSYERGTPATFPLNGVIAGWTEGLQLMSVGSSYRFYIPPALGYGEMGAGDMIGPNMLLVFDVELLSIEEE